MQTLAKTGLWNPEYYYKHSSTQFDHANRLINAYPFKGNEAILDIGCGDGKISANLASLVPEGRVIGLDCDLEALSFAQVTFSSEVHPNLRFMHGDITQIDKLGNFDLIVSFSCLHFIRDQLAALKNIKNNLKEDGKIILMLYRKCKYQWDALDKVIEDEKWRQYFKNYDPGYYEYLPDTYQALLKTANLNQFKAEFTAEEKIHYESGEEFNKFIKGWLPHLNILPNQYYPEFLDLFRYEYFNNLNIDENKIDVPFRRLVVT